MRNMVGDGNVLKEVLNANIVTNFLRVMSFVLKLIERPPRNKQKKRNLMQKQ